MSVNTTPEHAPEHIPDPRDQREESSSRFAKPYADDPPPGASTPAPSTPPEHKGHPSQPWKNYPKNKIELPTVGRVVYFYHYQLGGPMAAMVAAVDGYTVNLGVLLADGTGRSATGVQHMSEAPDGDRRVYWDWMPYQKGQAAKTEQLQAELDAKARGE